MLSRPLPPTSASAALSVTARRLRPPFTRATAPQALRRPPRAKTVPAPCLRTHIAPQERGRQHGKAAGTVANRHPRT